MPLASVGHLAGVTELLGVGEATTEERSVESRALRIETNRLSLYTPLRTRLLRSHWPALHHVPRPTATTSRTTGILITSLTCPECTLESPASPHAHLECI